MTASFGLVLVTLILVFQVFHNPPLTAGLMAGFFSATIAVRWFFGNYASGPKTIAEQGEDTKPDNVPR
ncbi:hypothetical protein JIN82_01180 [Persicirhabdus sediminis]|uniref:Uncharacterized protein n=1 Tax=Persicirhabdus sediminis TaxID=454144 RepID=A0A8J7SIS7_9BACT|nr:hypothetical protein [Persicirhabdus sediminis]